MYTFGLDSKSLPSRQENLIHNNSVTLLAEIAKCIEHLVLRLVCRYEPRLCLDFGRACSSTSFGYRQDSASPAGRICSVIYTERG